MITREPGARRNGPTVALIQIKPASRPAVTMESLVTHTFRETIMGRLLLAAALFVATMSITVSMAATSALSAQPEAGAITQYQDAN